MYYGAIAGCISIFVLGILRLAGFSDGADGMVQEAAQHLAAREIRFVSKYTPMHQYHLKDLWVNQKLSDKRHFSWPASWALFTRKYEHKKF